MNANNESFSAFNIASQKIYYKKMSKIIQNEPDQLTYTMDKYQVFYQVFFKALLPLEYSREISRFCT